MWPQLAREQGAVGLRGPGLASPAAGDCGGSTRETVIRGERADRGGDNVILVDVFVLLLYFQKQECCLPG